MRFFSQKSGFLFNPLGESNRGVSVEYLVTGNTVTLDNLKPEVMSISKILNRFSEKDLKLISDLINRLEKK